MSALHLNIIIVVPRILKARVGPSAQLWELNEMTAKLAEDQGLFWCFIPHVAPMAPVLALHNASPQNNSELKK